MEMSWMDLTLFVVPSLHSFAFRIINNKILERHWHDPVIIETCANGICSPFA